jgi:hypothetical protein
LETIRIKQQISKAKTFLKRKLITSIEYDAWEAASLSLLEEIFGKKSNYATAFLKQKESDDLILAGFGSPSAAELIRIISCQLKVLEGAVEYIEQKQTGITSENPKRNSSKTKHGGPAYVNEKRILQLKAIEHWDTSKLVRFCEEINSSFENGNYLSTGMLLRAILDHVPPVFEVSNFSGLANNWKGTKSFKESMERLEKSSRKISDSFLHTQIRKSETLPTSTQVDFSNDLDVLLAEIIRICKDK